jgi:hypothetical protein
MTSPLDAHGSRLDDPDFSGARLHGANFEGGKLTETRLINTEINANMWGSIDGLRINGVEVAPFVEAELDRRFPERAQLRSARDSDSMAAAWRVVEELWGRLVARARSLDEPLTHERVDEEWSFVETLRHLLFATDCWLGRAVKGESHPYHPWGLAGPWLTDPAALGLDVAATPSLDDVLDARRGRMDAVATTIAALTDAELDRVPELPGVPGWPDTPHTVRASLQTIIEEEWEHGCYADRDLDLLGART